MGQLLLYLRIYGWDLISSREDCIEKNQYSDCYCIISCYWKLL